MRAACVRHQNHLAHGIVALDGLGSDTKLVDRFVTNYAQKLLPAPTRANVADLDATQLGSRCNFVGLCFAFDTEVSSHPSELRASVAEQLAKRPRLLDGLSGAAFHAFIHLALGVRASSRTMVVEGLAYLSHSWLPVGGAASDLCTDATWGIGSVALLDALEAIRVEGRLQQRLADTWPAVELLRTGYFQKCMHAFAEPASQTKATNDLVQYARSVKLPANSVDAAALLLRATLHVYVRTVGSDYFLLHGVTAAFSLVALQPLLAPQAAKAVCRRFLLGLLATYVAQRQPVLCSVDAIFTGDAFDGAVSASAWKTLREAAVAPTADVRNEHAYKLTWLCLDRATNGIGDGEEGWLLYAAARKALFGSLTGRTGERPIAP